MYGWPRGKFVDISFDRIIVYNYNSFLTDYMYLMTRTTLQRTNI